MTETMSEGATTFTCADAIEVIRKQHEPYLPTVVEVIHTDPCHPDYSSGEWHAPSIQEQAEGLIWWCDGCNRQADLCSALPVLNMIGMEKPSPSATLPHPTKES